MNAYSREFQAPTEICNIEVEQSLLGTLFLANDALLHIKDYLLPEHFFEPMHRDVYEVISDMVRSGKVANPITVKTFLPETYKNLRIEGQPATVAAYLARIATAANPSSLITDAGLIRDMAKRRRLVSIAEEMLSSARNIEVDCDPNDLAEKAIVDLSDAMAGDDAIYGAVSFADALDDALEITNSAFSGRKTSGISYGFSPLEKLIGPLSPGQLIILGGATKQGKSALAGQLAMGAAEKGSPVWFYSGEMSPAELAMRESSRETKVSVSRQKRGKVVEADFERLVQFRTDHIHLPIFIQPKRLTVDAIVERAKLFVRKKGPGLIVIDHIGLVERGRGQKAMSEWEFGQEVTMNLKQLAREIECPVIGCAQLKKNTFAERGPLNEKFLDQIVARRPRYTDLIGAMERDADHVIIPFRPSVFLKEHEPPQHSDLHLKWESMVSDQERKAKIVLALSRESHWPRESDCGWDGATTTFYETGSENEPELVPAVDNPLGFF
ncbi:replicative DNA helicase [Aquamicrobium terrae]|uniref:DNA 5'-3' helicase n=1 Tax=Aquamicrobium terrae TaxID=1324945 RepID=A0ABV2MYA8_9HYPH